MKNSAVVKVGLSAISLALLAACNGENDEAKKLGFASVEEMKEVHAKGWHTKERYEEDSAKQQGYKSAAELRAALAKKEGEEKLRVQSEKEEKARKDSELAKQKSLNESLCKAAPQKGGGIARDALSQVVIDYNDLTFACNNMVRDR